LDDLRDLVRKDQIIPIYLRECDMETVKKTHFYLVDDNLATGSGFEKDSLNL
jgi:hypothetical protein